MPDSIIDTGEKRINEAVCIDTKRIYDSCVSKDCLEDLRVTFYAPAQMLVDNAVTVKCRDCTIEAVSIDVDEVPFDNGFYSVDVTYYFKLTFDCYSAPCTVPMVATGYTSFNKKCILYGSSGNVKVFVSNVSAEALDCPEAPPVHQPLCQGAGGRPGDSVYGCGMQLRLPRALPNLHAQVHYFHPGQQHPAGAPGQGCAGDPGPLFHHPDGAGCTDDHSRL